MKGRKPISRGSGNQLHQKLHIALQPVSHSKGQKKHQCHDTEENGNAQNPVGQKTVHMIGQLRFLGLVYHDLLHDLLDKIIFLVDDIRLIAPVQYLWKIHRIFCRDLRSCSRSFNATQRWFVISG